MTLLDEKERYFNQPKSMIYKNIRRRQDSYVRDTNRISSKVGEEKLVFLDSEIMEERTENIAFGELKKADSGIWGQYTVIDNYI